MDFYSYHGICTWSTEASPTLKQPFSHDRASCRVEYVFAKTDLTSNCQNEDERFGYRV